MDCYMQTYQEKRRTLTKQYHSHCLFNNSDFKIDFKEDGSVIGEFYCHEKYQGYDNMMHGGVLSALIDSAMTQCLFGYGIVGYTARLNIRYLKPVNINEFIKVHVKLENNKPNIYYRLRGYITQGNIKKLQADAVFWTAKKLI